MPGVLGPDDMNWLTPHYHSYRYLNRFEVMSRCLESFIRFELTLSGTFDKIKVLNRLHKWQFLPIFN